MVAPEILKRELERIDKSSDLGELSVSGSCVSREVVATYMQDEVSSPPVSNDLVDDTIYIHILTCQPQNNFIHLSIVHIERLDSSSTLLSIKKCGG
jgi:hypothetical protein